MKNVGVLTLGLKHNYGGILQATALYNFLKNTGYNPILVRKYPIQKGWKFMIIQALESLPFQNFKGIRMAHIKYKNNMHFFDHYMPNQTKIMTYKSEIESYLNESEIESFIVGSDQVWRYTYINDTEYDTYFLNFNLSKKIKKISYAASFGLDRWEEPSKKQDIKNYLSDFTAVSVRESSGQEICKNDFSRYNVQLVLDPTLLIDKSFYLNMIKDRRQENYDCITYILDENNKKNELVAEINSKYQHASKFNLLSKNSTLSIEDWVGSFNDTNFVITDSFHGMVFSIIFNKQFIVLINDNRGRDRFESLCSILGLQDRLIDPNQDIISNFQPIDYARVNENLQTLKVSSKKFLLDALG